MAWCVVEGMFDQIVVKPRNRRWQTVLIVVSAIAHGGLLAGLIVSAMWKIEKLPLVMDRPIDVSVQKMQASASLPRAANPLHVQHPEVKIHITKDTVQPTTQIAKDPNIGSTTGQTSKTSTCVGDDCLGTTTTACEGPDCIDTGEKPAHDDCLDPNPPEHCRPPPDPCDDPNPPASCKPPIVRPDVAKGLRTSGEDHIYPPDTVKQAMQRDGKTDVRAVVQVCVSAGGRVDGTRIMKSTGYQAYDDELISKIGNWGYRPYMIGKKASPMCSVVMFTYHVVR